MSLEEIKKRKEILHAEIISLAEEYKTKSSGIPVTDGELVALEPVYLMTPEELDGKTFKTPVITSPFVPAVYPSYPEPIMVMSGGNKSLKRRADLLSKKYTLRDVAKESFERLRK